MRRVLVGKLYQIKDGVTPLTSPISKEKEMDKIQKIIVVAPLKKGGKARELLTGIEFDTMYSYFDGSIKENVSITRGNNVITVVDLDFSFERGVSSCYDAKLYELNDYFKEHKDVDTYRKELEAIKQLGREKAGQSIKEAQEKEKESKVIRKKREKLIQKMQY